MSAACTDAGSARAAAAGLLRWHTRAIIPEALPTAGAVTSLRRSTGIVVSKALTTAGAITPSGLEQRDSGDATVAILKCLEHFQHGARSAARPATPPVLENRALRQRNHGAADATTRATTGSSCTTSDSTGAADATSTGTNTNTNTNTNTASTNTDADTTTAVWT